MTYAAESHTAESHTLGEPLSSEELLGVVARWQFEESMAGTAIERARACECGDGHAEFISHLSAQQDRERWRLDEVRAALDQLDKVLLGVRHCRKCNDALIKFAPRDAFQPRIITRG